MLTSRPPVALQRLISALTLSLLMGGLLAAGSAPAAARVPGLRILGTLPAPPPAAGLHGKIVYVDERNERMYYLYASRADGQASYLVEYDTRAAMPRALRDVRVAGPNGLPSYTSPYTVIADSRRRRLIMLAESKILVVELETFELADPWNLTTTLPGFLPTGMAYAPKEDRVYLVGDMSQSTNVSNAAFGRRIIGPGTAVIALGAKTGELAWVRPLPQCQQVLQSFGVGSLVARSRLRPHIYLACVTGGTGGGDAFPVQAGLLRLAIKERAGQSDALDFPIEFFPISGSYVEGSSSNGIAAFDPRTDRFFLQSLARTTPGTWVFDGGWSAWVGFISAPDASSNWLGLNQGTGHYYIGSGSGDGGYLLAADGRATPVPQGRLFDIEVDGFIATDPGSNRLFVPVRSESEPGYVRHLVIADRTPEAQPPQPTDYDALTADVPEGPGTTISFSGGVNGFGARAVLVGGYGGILHILGNPVPIGSFRRGDRGVTAARVPTVDLREVGAAAGAQAVVTDTNTEAELDDNGMDPLWVPATCLDGNGEAIENETEGPGGSVLVSCDLANEEVYAFASAGPISSQRVRVGASSFEARSWRDPKTGVNSRAVATAEGIELRAPAGTVSIARVTSRTHTAARGRPTTASARWERVISGVEITDPDGEKTLLGGCTSTPKGDDCQALFDEINDVLQLKMRIDAFRPRVVRTPKGAFAAVEQADANFYNARTVSNQGTTFATEAASRAVPALQVTVFNDSVERSRLIVQLAAIQTNSIYTITPIADEPPQIEPPIGGLDLGGGKGVGSAALDLGSPPVDDLAGAPEIGPAQPAPVLAVTPVQGVLAVLRRSPGEAALMASMWMLFASAGFAIRRRVGLLSLLSRGATR